MADAATETEEDTKKDEVTDKTLVWDSNALKADGTRGDYVQKTISPELYRQQKAAQTRQALVAGGAGLAAEGIQYGIGATIFSDPAIEAQRLEKARLAAELRKDPDYLTEAEKDARREAGLAPVQRKAEAVQKRIEKIAASTGDFSARNFLAAGTAGIKEIAQQSLEVEADIAAEDVRRQQVKADKDIQTRKSGEEIDAMFLELRNKYIREPLHKFVASVGKVTGTLMAHAPARSIDEQVADLRRQNVSEEEIAKFTKLARRRGPRRVEKLFDEALGTSPAAVEAKNKKLEMERQLKAEEAIADTRGERGEPTGGRGPIDTDIDATEAEVEASVGADERMRDVYREERNTAADKYDRVFKKRTDDKYAYGFRDGVWTVYRGDFPAQPYISPTTGEGVSFTLEEAKNSRNPNVRELYDLAVEKGLVE